MPGGAAAACASVGRRFGGAGGGPGAILAPGVGCKASPSSCQRVQRGTGRGGDGGGSWVLTGAGMCRGESPPSPFPAGGERSPGSVTLRPTRASPAFSEII